MLKNWWAAYILKKYIQPEDKKIIQDVCGVEDKNSIGEAFNKIANYIRRTHEK